MKSIRLKKIKKNVQVNYLGNKLNLTQKYIIFLKH